MQLQNTGEHVFIFEFPHIILLELLCFSYLFAGVSCTVYIDATQGVLHDQQCWHYLKLVRNAECQSCTKPTESDPHFSKIPRCLFFYVSECASLDPLFQDLVNIIFTYNHILLDLKIFIVSYPPNFIFAYKDHYCHKSAPHLFPGPSLTSFCLREENLGVGS